MKKAGLLYVLIWIMGMNLQVTAQGRFLAYRVSGTVTYEQQGKTGSLKIGKVLPASAEVTVGPNSSLVMICEEASKPMSFGPGRYMLGAFSAFCNPDDQSITASYLKYVWWQMTHPSRSQEDERKRNASAAGAVSRGCPGVDFLVGDTLNYYRENLVLRWKVHAPASRSEFALFSDARSPVALAKLKVKGGRIRTDSLENFLQPGVPLYWTVLLDGNEVCERRLVQVWDENNFREWFKTVENSLLPGGGEAEKNYQLGYIMEINHFPGEALRFYREALRREPKEKRYRLTVKRMEKELARR